jgi:glucose-1-phosphate cytidylyltransferase
VKTLILCGGRGTRAYPRTADLPKALLEVGGTPVLRHVMDIYARQGFTDFVLAAGFKVEMVERFAETLPRAWRVEVRDTGQDTNTGGRVVACAHEMGPTYFLTYCDGLGDVDLGELLDFHCSHGAATTLTTVPLTSQFGTIDVDVSGRVTMFREKPRLDGHWINAGFMVVDARAVLWFLGDDFEKDCLPALGSAGELFAYRHDGFWRSMDTYKDVLELNDMCSDCDPPWSRRIEHYGRATL